MSTQHTRDEEEEIQSAESAQEAGYNPEQSADVLSSEESEQDEPEPAEIHAFSASTHTLQRRCFRPLQQVEALGQCVRHLHDHFRSLQESGRRPERKTAALTIENTDSDLEVHSLHYTNEVLKNFCKLAKQTKK